MNFFQRLAKQLKPTTWKSETQLSQKRATDLETDGERKGESIFYTRPLSKSSDWTDVDLEVPQKEDEPVHLRNPKLTLIFDKEDGTPTPPPRKNHKGTNIREKIGKIAREGLQALQGGEKNNQKPVEEPTIIKKKINYSCPACEGDEANHNRNHHHDHVQKNTSSNKNARKKNPSVMSLPNYTDLKLSLANTDSKSSSKPDLNSSSLSLQTPGGKKLNTSSSTGRLDAYITRCRSFGSLLPQQLKKLKQPPKLDKKEDVTSDDSFGPLEDWDLGLIEHYNPKDTSLPRPRKPPVPKKTESEVLSGIESLIVNEEDLPPPKPKPPVRRSESLVKKNQKVPQQAAISKPAPEEVCLTPPPSPPQVKPPIPTKRTAQEQPEQKPVEADPMEHSSLMRILQEFSIKDKQEHTSRAEGETDLPSLTPSLVEFEKNLNPGNLVEDFINAEKSHSRAVLS
ncbi:uncharacterized protein LOC143203514 isoform X2 [Rhynchophorus ferrugineus]|uniref:uncharacterized protein LOC143203514 isoform X2 n=1 Tax=Rhynchophorus ferrugineus TaxID=354439 RepID=UPI003FCEDE4B